MKLRNRSTWVVALLIMVLAWLGISGVQASSAYFYRILDLTPNTATCSTVGALIGFSVNSSGTLEYSFPAQGGHLIADAFINGINVAHSDNPVSGSFSGTTGYGVSASLIISYPLTAEFPYLTVIDGQPVYSSTVSFTCTGDGTFPITITNIDLTSGGGSAIHDGRINPENYAPVALYCDGSVLNAYKIDATGGTFAWSFDLSKSSAGNPLISQLGIALSQTGDGRFSVLAPQLDRKQYLFVFNGCPSPGATETYVSDPVTGQFVRTE